MDTNKLDDNNNNNLAVSESIFDNNVKINHEVLSDYFKKDLNLSSDRREKNQNHADLINLVEASLSGISSKSFEKEITNGLKVFEFDAGFGNVEDFNYRVLRKKSHALTVAACAQACYFVGIANRIRRNIEDIKAGIIKTKNSMLMNEINKTPGLQIGIIGCGKLGRQLASSLLEFAEVYPNELQLSTRQPDTLSYFKSKNVRCSFENAKVASSVNILFICVLPSQLEIVINEIKKALPEKCMVYNLVRVETESHLKNLLHEAISRIFVIKPDFLMNKRILDYNWNYSLSIIESLNTLEMIKLSNPFANNNFETLYINSTRKMASIVYAFLDICAFLNLSKPETLITLRNYLFTSNNKNFKIEENHFYETPSESNFFPIVDLVETANKATPVSNKIEQSKSFSAALSKNYIEYFMEIYRWNGTAPTNVKT